MPRLFKKILLWCVGIFVVLLVVGWVALKYLALKYEHEFELASQRLKDQGAPMILEEILPPPIPDGENATFLFDQAGLFSDEHEDALERINGKLEEITDDGDRPWADYDETALAQLKQCLDEPVFIEYQKLLDKASEQDRYYIELRDKKPIEIVGLLIPSIGDIIQASRLYSMHALLAEYAGEHAIALDYIERQFHLADVTHQFPILVIELTSVHVAGRCLNDVEQFTTLDELSSDILKELKAAIDVPDYRADFVHAMDFERLGFSDSCWILFKENPASINDLVDEFTPGLLLQLPGAEAFYFREKAYFTAAVAELRALYLNADGKKMEAIEKREREIIMDAHDSYVFFTQILLPVYTTIYGKMVKIDAITAITRTALCLQMYHNDHGAYPDALDALVPDYLEEIPIDPFTGEPLVYRKVDDGFQLYSLGPNQIDDGGYEDPDDPKDFDIAWQGRGAVTVEAPAM